MEPAHDCSMGKHMSSIGRIWLTLCVLGEETKLALNSKYSGNKFSSCELAVNGFLMFFIFILIAEMIASLGAKMVIERRNPNRELYLGPGTPQPAPVGYLLQDFFSFLLLYYYIIPMSLYVTIELYKFIGEWGLQLLNILLLYQNIKYSY